MQKHTESADRRRVLRSLAAGGGILTSAHVLPETWVAPIVDSVVLPIHAQMSVGTSCGPVTAVSDDPNTDIDLDRLLVLFDGSNCSLELQDGEVANPDSVSDLLIVLDADTGDYEVESVGSSDWSVSGVSPGTGLTDPQLVLTATRLTGPGAGDEFDVVLDLEVTGTTLTVSATISPA
ncbi:MAG TPA: hypothetical protein VK973_05420 [Arenicellales bacterium]|nr:hypothetical protein [Arenicellales bacterium]